MISAADACLTRANWQGTLFAVTPQRRQLLALTPTWSTRIVRLRVHRNHAFEPVASALAPYLAFAGYEADVMYSSYDDSLSFATPGAADVELLWLDFTRYHARDAASGDAASGDAASGDAASASEELAAWMAGRIAVLRAQSAAPILVPDFAEDSDTARAFNRALRERTAALPGVYVCDEEALRDELGSAYFDDRAAALTGTRVSNAGCLRNARVLGSRWIPGVLAPRLKAIALDLDNTLYAGVLGEDGPAGVQLTEGHAALQRRLIELREEGLFLAVCSRNEAADVRELFATRTDFPLRPEHLSLMEVSWDPKASGIARTAAALRIGVDAVLFVDDNPGELAAVVTALPEVKTLYAGPRAEDTLAALAYYPGLHRWRADATDVLRARDLAAAQTREHLAVQAMDPGEYLRALGVRLEFAVDARDELARLADLSGKTNQFNLSLRRLSPTEVGRYMDAADHSAVSIGLSDRLADSGIVGAVFVRHDGDALLVDDLCISCRALGRELEDVMVTEAIRMAMASTGPAREVRFRPVTGPRNAPARTWLDRYLGQGATPDADGWITSAWDEAQRAQRVASTPVTIHHENGT